MGVPTGTQPDELPTIQVPQNIHPLPEEIGTNSDEEGAHHEVNKVQGSQGEEETVRPEGKQETGKDEVGQDLHDPGAAKFPAKPVVFKKSGKKTKAVDPQPQRQEPVGSGEKDEAQEVSLPEEKYPETGKSKPKGEIHGNDVGELPVGTNIKEVAMVQDISLAPGLVSSEEPVNDINPRRPGNPGQQLSHEHHSCRG